MNNNYSFKQRVCETAIKCSKIYMTEFIENSYLICPNAFTNNPYYVINAHADNFQHLLGIHSLVPAKDFFDKCYNGTLTVNDFDFIKPHQDEKIVKGFVRRKISILPVALNIFHSDNIFVEENFSKNRIIRSFATSDNLCTFGFENHRYSVPKTLLKGNELNLRNSKPVDLVLKKSRSSKYFSEIVIGTSKELELYLPAIKELKKF